MHSKSIHFARFSAPILACSIYALTANPASAQEAGSSDWNGSIGVLALGAPAYPGANNEHGYIYPFGNVIYKNEWFFRTDSIPGASIRGLGAYLYHQNGWELTLSLAPSLEEREASDDPRFHNLGDVGPTVRGAFAASYQHDWWKISTAITRDLSESKKEGVTGGMDFTATYNYSPSLSFRAGPGFTYANAEYMRTFYGVSNAQSQASGLPVYNADGGVSNVHIGAGVNYHFGGKWDLGTFVTQSRLTGDAANSPIIETRNQTNVGIYLQRQL